MRQHRRKTFKHGTEEREGRPVSLMTLRHELWHHIRSNTHRHNDRISLSLLSWVMRQTTSTNQLVKMTFKKKLGSETTLSCREEHSHHRDGFILTSDFSVHFRNDAAATTHSWKKSETSCTDYQSKCGRIIWNNSLIKFYDFFSK